jgi:predicted DCC family thiol-disulfide oxidoreductase YuxK
MRPAVLIYDGECPVCVNAVEWIRGRSRTGGFEFLSCHSDTLPSRFPSINKEACLRAMHLVLPDGMVLAGERALPEILRRLRRYRWSASLFRLPGVLPVAGAFYRWFAKRRHRAAGFFSPGKKTRGRKTH